MEPNATHNSTSSTSNRNNIPVGNFILPVSLFGMVGNGIVVWILGCYLKRNPFTTYILNLSIVDFVVLVALATISICVHLSELHYAYCPSGLEAPLLLLFLCTFNASELLLTVISLDRCVCLFFPLWHKCHRPPHLSTIVCVAIWIFIFLISIVFIAIILTLEYIHLLYYLLILISALCMPTMAISTTAMLIKVCFLSPHHQRGKLLTAILLALLFFLFFAFPMNVSLSLSIDHIPASFYFDYYAPIGASLNSAINPVIYFLLGRDKKAQSRVRIKKKFEQLFQEEEYCKENVESPLETHL